MQKKNIIVSKHTQKKTKDIQRIRSASHHQKWAKVASQQAPDAAGDQSKEEEKKKTGGGVLPIKFIQKKGEEEEGQRDAEGSASPHEDVKKKKTWGGKERKRLRVNDPSKCEVPRTTFTLHTTYIWASAYSETDCTQAREEKPWVVREWTQRRKRLDGRERERQRMGGASVIPQKETDFWQQKHLKRQNKEIKPWVWNTAKRLRSVSQHPTVHNHWETRTIQSSIKNRKPQKSKKKATKNPTFLLSFISGRLNLWTDSPLDCPFTYAALISTLGRAAAPQQ